ncbi:non-homologous end-joining DNA ligase [Streptomyces sp. NPDC059740]|uniref:non-homologous end-joining DNA ligase n=1 Tax=Streptomyces sp. NPDC059740 TaxID=3346926 RepID=UPI0036596EDB
MSSGTGTSRNAPGDDRRETTLRVGRRTLDLPRPDKVLFPGDGITKEDLARHYQAVASRALPHLRGRPLMMERHPDGIDGRPLMQKNAPDYFPDWITRSTQAKEGGEVVHVVCDDAATLVYLAVQASITQHRWLSRADHPDHPDVLIVDLDPAPDGDFAEVRWAARQVCTLCDDLGLPVRLMTTGSRGLHVLLPLDAKADYDTVREFAKALADTLAARHPDRLTTEPRKDARKGRLYLDVQRNAYAQTAVAPYSVRARPGAPVATPVSRDALDDPDLRPDGWTIRTFDSYLEAEDPWSGDTWRGHSASAAHRRLRKVAGEE